MFKIIILLFITFKSYSSSQIIPGFYEGFNPQLESKCLIEVVNVTHMQRRKSPIHRTLHIMHRGFLLRLRHSYQYDIQIEGISNFVFDRKTMSDLYQIGQRLYAAKVYLDPLKNYTTLYSFRFIDPMEEMFECTHLTKVDSVR